MNCNNLYDNYTQYFNSYNQIIFVNGNEIAWTLNGLNFDRVNGRRGVRKGVSTYIHGDDFGENDKMKPISRL